MSCELLIQHGANAMLPPVVEDVTIEWERQGQPGKMTFEVVKTDGLSFQEGDPCRFSVDGTPIFYGFVFEKSRKGSNPAVIQVTAYDQLYLIVFDIRDPRSEDLRLLVLYQRFLFLRVQHFKSY